MSHKENVLFADNSSIESEGRGTLRVNWHEFVIKLMDVLYSKELQCNFMSVTKAKDNGLIVNFSKNNAKIINSNGTVILSHTHTHKHKNGQICLYLKTRLIAASVPHLWHNRIGHLNFGCLNKMIKENLVKGLKSKLNSGNVCETCAKIKVCVKKFPKASKNCATECAIQ